MTDQPDIEKFITDKMIELGASLTAEITKVLQVILDGVVARVDSLESTIDSVEQRLAILTAGYAELATMITALVARVGSGSQEEIDAFNAEVSRGRKEMLEILKNQSSDSFQAFQQKS